MFETIHETKPITYERVPVPKKKNAEPMSADKTKQYKMWGHSAYREA